MAACIPKGAQGLPEKYPLMVHTVVTHMAQDPTQKPTQSIDLQMLTKLAMPDVAVKGAQALVAAAGGLQAVYRAMQEHQHGAEVQAQACLALSVVACDRPDNQFRLMEFWLAKLNISGIGAVNVMGEVFHCTSTSSRSRRCMTRMRGCHKEGFVRKRKNVAGLQVGKALGYRVVLKAHRVSKHENIQIPWRCANERGRVRTLHALDALARSMRWMQCQ